jgi:hypothetical protein
MIPIVKTLKIRADHGWEPYVFSTIPIVKTLKKTLKIRADHGWETLRICNDFTMKY